MKNFLRSLYICIFKRENYVSLKDTLIELPCGMFSKGCGRAFCNHKLVVSKDGLNDFLFVIRGEFE